MMEHSCLEELTPNLDHNLFFTKDNYGSDVTLIVDQMDTEWLINWLARRGWGIHPEGGVCKNSNLENSVWAPSWLGALREELEKVSL